MPLQGARRPAFRSSGLLIRRVSNVHEQRESDYLVRRMYAWRGYRTGDQSAEQRWCEVVGMTTGDSFFRGEACGKEFIFVEW